MLPDLAPPCVVTAFSVQRVIMLFLPSTSETEIGNLGSHDPGFIYIHDTPCTYLVLKTQVSWSRAFVGPRRQ